MDAFKLARVSLTLLRAFEATARHLSFSRAASELCRSQATISVQVRSLERQLDVRLLDRTTRRVTLTDAGHALADGLKTGFDAITDGLSNARQFADSRRGRVTIACVPSLSGFRLPSILAAYRDKDPLTKVDVEELNYTEMVEAIQAGKVDFGIGPSANPPPASITFNGIVSDPLCILLHVKEGIKAGPIPLDILEGRDLIVLSRTAPVNQSLKDAAVGKNIELNIQHKVRHVSTAIGMVRAGLGAAIVPRLALPDIADEDLCILLIDEPLLIRRIGILTFRGRRLPPIPTKIARFVNSALAKMEI